jgi:hypothetical protein
VLAGVYEVPNLVPFRLQERRGEAPPRSDGRVALDALKVVWALR